MIGRVNVGGSGSSGNIYALIKVTYVEGATCVCSNGKTTLTASDTTGVYVFCVNAAGDWTITISMDGKTPKSKTVTITDKWEIETVRLTFGEIFGIHWSGTELTSCTRTNASASFSDPIPYVSGASSYGSPFDTISPWADISRVEDDDCGSLVAIPKFWYKLSIDSEGSLDLQIANEEFDGFKVSPAHMDRGDGKGEREVIYVGRYHCAAEYKSTTGVVPLTSQTRATFRSGIRNLGSDVWQMDFATIITIWMLYLVEFADWNSQNTLGIGCGNGDNTEAMGYTDSMPYHTGTMQTSKSIPGVGIQYRYIEGLWENVRDWCDGIYFNKLNVYGILNPAKFSDNQNGELICERTNATGFISEWQKGTDDFDWFLYPSSCVGSATSYVGDYCSFTTGGLVLDVGGNFSDVSLENGLFALEGTRTATSTHGGIGSRIIKLP